MSVRVDYTNAIHDADLDTIYITGGGYIDYPFRGVSRDSAWGWDEPVWGGELTRSVDRVLSNIGDVEFGFVARCEISFKYMNIQDYKALMAISKQRTCLVTYYNRQTGQQVTRKEMAFTGNELGRLYKMGADDVGRSDVSIKLVATNREEEYANLISTAVTIKYDPGTGSGTIVDNWAEKPDGTEYSRNLKYADEYKLSIGTGFTKTGYYVSKWTTNADGTGSEFLPGQRITVFGNLTLYAQWTQS